MYGITFFALRKRLNGINPALGHASTTTGTGRNTISNAQNSESARKVTRATMYMILYPTIYVLTTLPLAAGRISGMVGRPAPRLYLLSSGIMMSCGGWLNVLLYSLTRRIFVISSTPSATHQDRKHYTVGTVNNGAIELTKSGIHHQTGKYGELPSPGGSTDNIVIQTGGKDDGSIFGAGSNGGKNEGVIMKTTWEVKTESVRAASIDGTRSKRNSGGLGHHTFIT